MFDWQRNAEFELVRNLCCNLLFSSCFIICPFIPFNACIDMTIMSENLPNSKTLDDSYINFVRVSVAVAIIRSKPDNFKDSQEYALHLRKLFLNRQNDWRREYERVKNELLSLKQSQALRGISADELTDLTPPQTQISLHASSSENDSKDDDVEVGSVPERMNKHHVFLSKMATIKNYSSGSSMAWNSTTIATVVETFCDSLDAIRASLLGEGSLDSEAVDTRRQLVRCMVDLLKISAAVEKCRHVQKNLEQFYAVCLQHMLEPRDAACTRTFERSEEIAKILMLFSKRAPGSVMICKQIMSRICQVTQQLVVANFSSFTRDRKLLKQVENIPRVTKVLVTAHHNRMKSADAVGSESILSLLELMTLRENLEKTLTKFPLYTMHMRELLTTTGHKLPDNNQWSDSD